MPSPVIEMPREVINWRLLWASFVFCLLGASRGLDEGLVGGISTMKSFVNEFGLDSGSEAHQDELISNIVSMVQLGCIFGSLLAFVTCDRYGRVSTLQILSFLWLIGVIIVIWSHENLAQLMAGRFITGLGIGMTVVVGPIYLAEIAPMNIRGMVTCIFSGFHYVGTTVGFLSNWRASVTFPETSRQQWIAPQFTHIAFAVFLLMASFTIPETPRFHMLRGSGTEAIKALRKIRQLSADHPYVQTEIIAIRRQYMRDLGAIHGLTIWSKTRELVLLPSNRYRLMLGVMAQIFSQWSGASSISIYAPTFFKALGDTSHSEKLLAGCVLGVVELTTACLCALVLVESTGRRRTLYFGILLQTFAFCYLASFLGIFSWSRVGGDNSVPPFRSSLHVAVGMVVVSGVGWAAGWNSAQYLINADIWPLRIRALGTSLVMCLHFVNQLGHTKLVSPMLLTLETHAFFTISVGVSLLGLVFVWFFVPELAGMSVEGTDNLFSLPWYKIGRGGRDIVSGNGNDV